MSTIAPWRVFHAQVCRLRRLSPSFVRVTLTGEELDRFADNGYDQRIKLVLPLPGHGLAHLPTGPDWYQRWRELPDQLRNPVRTYTVRAVRPAQREVDVDLVRHGESGPASRWAATARPGDPVALVGPDARYPGEHGGVEFRPPAAAQALLLVGDETAVPAVAAILERLPRDLAGEVVLEVPAAGDALALGAPDRLRVTWLVREGGDHGALLVPEVRAAAHRLLAAHPAPALPAPAHPAPARPGRTADEVDVDGNGEPLWEVPQPPAAGDHPGLYAWLAGEAGVIRTLRRHLVSERGLDRRAVAFMGYWRRGHPEGS